jgi:hypothetical protein
MRPAVAGGGSTHTPEMVDGVARLRLRLRDRDRVTAAFPV